MSQPGNCGHRPTCIRELATSFLLLCLVAGLSDSCFAQKTARPKVTVSVAPADVERHVPGRWTALSLSGANHSDVDVEETIVVSCGADPNLQFARRLWIPANARRQTWLPILIPETIERPTQHVAMTSMRIKEKSGFEQFEHNVLGQPTVERSLLISWDESQAAALLDATDDKQQSYGDAQYLYWTVNVGRDATVGSDQGLGVASLTHPFLPTSPQTLDSIDQIVLAGDRIVNDTTSVRKLRSWLRSGGRMWIMLDQVDHDFIQRLLGDSMCYSVVDTVEMNDFDLDLITGNRTKNEIYGESWSSDRSVKLVRVFTDTVEIQCRVNGWPAAFWKDFGQGEILFTTLGAAGWFRGRSALKAFRSLNDRFFVHRLRPANNTAFVATSLQNDIGYQVPRRSLVATALCLYLVVFLVSASWLSRRQSMQQMAFVVPVLALAASGSLVAIGRSHTKAVQSTIATGQIARVSAENSEVQVDSLSAVYSQLKHPLSIDSSPGSMTMLSQDREAQIRRILWTDDGHSHWKFIDQRPGVVRHVKTTASIPLPEPWLVKGRFTSSGFEGQLLGLPADQCEDPVIVAAAVPALSVKLKPTSSAVFQGQVRDLFVPNRYIDDALMTDRQRYRQTMLRRLIKPDQPRFGRQPTLLVWTKAIDAGVSFAGQYDRRGWALVAVPIQLQRLPANADFKLPATFVRVEAFEGISSFFNPQTGRWFQDMNRAAVEQLQFMVPLEVLPCQVKRGELVIKINAPSRTLEIRGLVDGKFVTLHRKKNPNGLLRFDLQRQDALQLDDNGGLRLAIAVSDSEPSPLLNGDGENDANESDSASRRLTPNRNTWQIEYVHLSLECSTL